jgi:hypothetical protein
MDNETKKQTVSNPLERVVIWLMILNVVYWVFSEVYIHNGGILDGVIYGVIASFLSLGLGFLIGHALKRV